MSMSRSASMYNSPFTYKPPPPRIEYPSFFYGCKDLTFRHVLDSKMLAISVLVLGIGVIIVVGMIIAPFWFELVFNPTEGTFGSMPVMRQLSIESGLFFMKESQFDNLDFTDHFTGRDALPKQLQAAQFFAVLGSCVLVPCLAGGIMLMCRQLASPTALFILAGAVSLGAVSEILVVILCGSVFGESSCDPYGNSQCNYGDNLVWRMLPIYTQLYRIEPHTTPYVKPSWAFYIAIVGAGVTIAAAVCFWIEAFLNGNRLGKIRYQQLRQARDQFEHDIDPYVGKKYKYQPPTQQGSNTYGMQPVVHSVRYDGTIIAAPEERGYIPPASFYKEEPSFYKEPPSPRFERGGPPSTISSTSGPIVSREIDL